MWEIAQRARSDAALLQEVSLRELDAVIDRFERKRAEWSQPTGKLAFPAQQRSPSRCGHVSEAGGQGACYKDN